MQGRFFEILFLVDDFIIRDAIFLHQFFDAVDVLLGNASADIHAHAVVFADGYLFQLHADVPIL